MFSGLVLLLLEFSLIHLQINANTGHCMPKSRYIIDARQTLFVAIKNIYVNVYQRHRIGRISVVAECKQLIEHIGLVFEAQ